MSDLKPNPFYKLYDKAIKTSERPYNGRGILLKRCPQCQLSKPYCICNNIKTIQSNIEFALIFHRDEVFKPTNSGRLIGEVFPEQSHFFIWDRTAPPEQLLKMINDPNRDCYLLFPADSKELHNCAERLQTTAKDRLITLIVLDGTWRQARRMFNRSEWLQGLKVLTLNPQKVAEYSTREAAHEHYLSTAESVVLALEISQYESERSALQQVFTLFNKHYYLMKNNILPS
ncbi:MAG: DTW domain-containing protein [Gammaproteobacteria bacterium]|nr:DTW domain-containing protein [Gammaproteobacteria bacterium]